MQLSTVINRLNRSNPEPIYIGLFIPYLSGDEYEGEDYVFNIGARLVQYSDLKIGIPEINGDKL